MSNPTADVKVRVIDPRVTIAEDPVPAAADTHDADTAAPAELPVRAVDLRSADAAAEILLTSPPTGIYQPLKLINSEKYLGITIDSKLNFNNHIENVCSSATKILNLCRRNLHMCSRATKELAYKAVVRPRLEYASTAWNPYTACSVNKVEMVQRRAARFVLGNYTYGPDAHLTEQIKNDLKWQSMQHRRSLSDLNLFFKIRHNIVNINYPPSVHPNLRKLNYYQQIQANNADAYKFSFYPRVIRLWNQLPPVIASTPKVDPACNLCRTPATMPVSCSCGLDLFKSRITPWTASKVWQRKPGVGTWELV